MNRILVTGGAGFMGSAFVRYLLGKYPDYRVVVLDKLTYAGNLDNLKPVEAAPRYKFVHGDICDASLVERVVAEHDIEAIVNFAAETHVDRSLLDPTAFIQTDIFGTYVLLEATRKAGLARFVQISTDEVYGHIEIGSAQEIAPLRPRSPYAASKAGGDLMALAYFASYGVPMCITRASNNFGPYQYPEKFIPLFVTNAIDGQPLPLYGDGRQVRDWLYVDDHSEGVDLVLHKGVPGEVYNLGGGNERFNIDIAQAIVDLLGQPQDLIRHVIDRPGHDRRYSVDASTAHALGWRPRHRFEDALAATVRWYVENEWWWRKIKSGEYWDYYQRQYGERLGLRS